MADPTLQTPALPSGFQVWQLHRCPPAHSNSFCTTSRTLVSGVAVPAPAFVRANTGAYPADPTLQTPVMPTTTWIDAVYRAGGAGTLATMKGGIDTAAAAVVWPAPPFPHANTGVYP